MSTRRLVLLLGVVACAVVAIIALSLNDGSPEDSTEQPTPSAVGPLTGLPTNASVTRRALVVKVDSHPDVSTYPGVENADVIYEVLVEGGITRFLAIFQSKDAETVGPVRSLRSTDFDLTANLGDPAVLYSGANDPTEAAADAASLVRFTPSSSGFSDVFRRDDSIAAPHNLFVSTAAAREAIDDEGSVAPPWEISPDGPQNGSAAAGLSINFGASTDVALTWDSTRSEWLRWEGEVPAVDGAGTQLGTANVVVIDTEYGKAPWDPGIPVALSVGSGGGLLLTNGSSQVVSWSRTDSSEPFTLSDEEGERVTLPPGRTWVAFAPPGSATVQPTLE